MNPMNYAGRIAETPIHVLQEESEPYKLADFVKEPAESQAELGDIEAEEWTRETLITGFGQKTSQRHTKFD